MTQEQLKELFKYIEQKWDVAVEDIHKTDIKRIFGVVLTEAKAEPELNEIEREFHDYKPIRLKIWGANDWIKKHSNSQIITNLNNIYDIDEYEFYFNSMKNTPEEWELYEPKVALTEPSSQAILDNSFDRERFERMFCAVVASGHNDNFEADLIDAKYLYEQLELYYYNN